MKRNILSALLALTLSFEILAANTALWTMVDCNAGRVTQDCHILQEGGITAIIDTGTVEATERYFIPYLKQNKIDKVEHFIVSHPHNNHVGGLLSIMRAKVSIENIYFNTPVEGHSDFAYDPLEFQALLDEASRLGAKLHSVDKGDVIRLGDSIIEVLQSPKTRQAEINDYSIIMRWRASGYTTLFSGDLSINLGSKLSGDNIFSADFYKAPHHGVTPIAPTSFSDTVNPILTMVPGPINLWNHPRGREFREWTILRKRENNMITCTNGLNGHVSLFLSNTFFEIRPQREANGCKAQTISVKGRNVPELEVNFDSIPIIVSYLLDLIEKIK